MNIDKKYKEACEYLRARGIDPFNMQNVTKNTENAPKYDPCRRFRKGDRARIVEYKGRNGTSSHPTGAVVTVDKDEEDCEWVFLKADDEHKLDVIDPAYLELVSPVEELEPYYIEKHGEKPGGLCYTVHKHGGYAESSFYYGTCRTRDEAQAKAAAEAERDRLNKPYRKELDK